MSLRRYAAKRDAAEGPLRAGLADAGWLTQPLSIKDWPDLLCAKGGRLVLCECKSDRKVSHQKGDGRSEGQRACHALLLMFGVKCIVATTVEEFLRAVGELG